MERYTYKHYRPFAQPGGFTDGHREKKFEEGDIGYAILQPNPPYDDDSMLVRWDTIKKRWITNFDMVISGGTYPTGKVIQDGSDSGERAALVLLGHFGLEKRAEEFSPERVGCMSPGDLEQLAKEPRKNAPPNP